MKNRSWVVKTNSSKKWILILNNRSNREIKIINKQNNKIDRAHHYLIIMNIKAIAKSFQSTIIKEIHHMTFKGKSIKRRKVWVNSKVRTHRIILKITTKVIKSISFNQTYLLRKELKTYTRRQVNSRVTILFMIRSSLLEEHMEWEVSIKIYLINKNMYYNQLKWIHLIITT